MACINAVWASAPHTDRPQPPQRPQQLPHLLHPLNRMSQPATIHGGYDQRMTIVAGGHPAQPPEETYVTAQTAAQPCRLPSGHPTWSDLRPRRSPR